MATQIAPPEHDLPNIRKHLRAPRPFWRIFGWGGLATIALAAVAITSQTEAGSKRLQFMIAYFSEPSRVFADLSEPARAVAEIPTRTGGNATEAQPETQRLAAQVRELTADRERLNARIAMLEHNIEDMTGSIKQQSAQLAAARAATPPPTSSAPTSTLPTVRPLAMPALGVMPQPESPPLQAAEAKTETVSTPPVRVASAPANEPAATPPPVKAEFGIDLGSATTIDALRVHWAAVKANYGPLLAGLHPLVAEHPKQPTGVVYHLVAGPLPNAAEAARLCTRFPALRTGCKTAKFEGGHLPER